MIFPHLDIEDKVQLNDRTRLDGSKSFTSPDEEPISLVRIKPEASGDFIDVTDILYLDWEYATAGTKTVSIEITTDGVATVETATLVVVAAADDHLFSEDADLIQYEHDILKYVGKGRNTFLNIHRAAQGLIMDYLYRNGFLDDDGNRLEPAAIVDVEEVQIWSTFLALQIIFDGLWNSVDDVFYRKARRYEEMANEARQKYLIKLDLDGDGVADDSETVLFTAKLVRR